ncbi:hemerythrin domain-containing protein [Sinanaerobacter sp. ZZT-01]|uniref:bacteriohemerythrin n=1 Tax=Sinanaerobacter sp. ZZT-01 TaxID=3111540 RepID=UPI002D78A176|nr:hemerythrin domain-containing protein [Sinanaerobacter sp. ZZT-01]WRR94296.1 hemerythrin domain-containing protein [Sinanaerobacter sp. ZZT-01]
MPTIPWDKKFATEIPLIDSQHKHFLLKANLFYAKCKIHPASTELEADLSLLEQLFLSHCLNEEGFQKESHYPYFHHHLASHDRLRASMREIGHFLRKASFSDQAVQELYDFLSSPFIDHLLFEDIKFARYWKEKASL